ncbi:hypothetical protein PTTG_30385, partial [Puccinia triticina 1-1 BBBD Race 1]
KLTAVDLVCSRTPSDLAQLKVQWVRRSFSPFAYNSLATFAADPHSPAQSSFSASAASLLSLFRGLKPHFADPPSLPSLPSLGGGSHQEDLLSRPSVAQPCLLQADVCRRPERSVLSDQV